MDTTAIANFTIQKVQNGNITELRDQLAVEEPLEIRLQYSNMQKNIAVTMRTPGNDEELATGFLFTEGIIQHSSAILSVQHVNADNNIISVTLHPGIEPQLQKTERNFYTTSSCGVCGKASIDAIKTISPFAPTADNLVVTDEILYQLTDTLQTQQAVFESTGGLHASALFDLNGKFIALREDVGRHNALDKLIGYHLLQDQLPADNAILLLSGRASFELIQKAAMAGIKIIAAVGAPSSLAVNLAAEYKMTLVGFLRNKRFNIYTGNQRIRISALA
ncbi:MAG: formate dehydrogenase accessory sulfurtransferase FdhD [Chitinophagaceae bacterium]